jgi:hypothetical protein
MNQPSAIRRCHCFAALSAMAIMIRAGSRALGMTAMGLARLKYGWTNLSRRPYGASTIGMCASPPVRSSAMPRNGSPRRLQPLAQSTMIALAGVHSSGCWGLVMLDSEGRSIASIAIGSLLRDKCYGAFDPVGEISPVQRRISSAWRVTPVFGTTRTDGRSGLISVLGGKGRFEDAKGDGIVSGARVGPPGADANVYFDLVINVKK